MNTVGRVVYAAVVHEGFTEVTLEEDFRAMILRANKELIVQGFSPQVDTVDISVDWWNMTKEWRTPAGQIIRGVGIAKVSIMGIKGA